MPPPRPLEGCSARGQGAVLGRGVRDSRILGKGRVWERESPSGPEQTSHSHPKRHFCDLAY